MIGFVVRRLRGRLPLVAAVLLTVLITTTALTALLAFTRTVGDAGLRRTLTAGAGTRTAVLLTAEHGADTRRGDDEAVRAFSAGLFGGLPAGVESAARSRSYGLPGARAEGKDADLTLLAALDRSRVRLLAGRWPDAVGDRPALFPVAVPQAALTRLGLTAQALPAEVRLDDRYGGAPLGVLVTGVYRAERPEDPYWRLDPLGGQEVQIGSFTTYGPLLVDDSAFTAGKLPQNGRAVLLTPDFSTARTAEVEGVRTRAQAAAVARPAGLTVTTELPQLLAELNSAQRVARSTLLVGALQLAVLAAAALLLVSHLLTERQEPERALLTARGASRRRLGLLSAFESLVLALPAAVLAPLLTPFLLRLLAGHGALAQVPLATGRTWLLWPVAAGLALLCVLLTTVPALLRGAAAGALRRAGRRRALVSGIARSGADLALLALAAVAYRQLAAYSGDEGPSGAGGGLGVDPVLVAAPTLALCAGTLLVLRLLPLAARLGGRIAARGRGLGPALVGWQLSRRPGRATGPVLLLVLAVSSGVLALGQHTAWTASQRDQADFTTAGGLRITGSDLPAPGRGGRYAALPGGDRVTPVIRSGHELPGGVAGQVLAVDAPAFADRVPLRADLRDGRPMRELFAPLAGDTPAGPGIALPGQPQRIDLDVAVRATGSSGSPQLSLLLRDRYGLTYRSPLTALPDDGRATVPVDVAALTGAPLGSAAGPLDIAGIVLVYGAGMSVPGGTPVGPLDAEVTLHRVSVAAAQGGPAVPVEAAAPSWYLTAPTLSSGKAAASLPAAGPGTDGALMRVKYQGLPQLDGSQLTLTTAGAPATEIPGIATRAYLKAVGSAVGDVVPVRLGVDAVVPVRITTAVGSLPVAGGTAVAVDLGAAGRLLAAREGREVPAPDEWWMPAASADDPAPARAAAELRAGAGHQQLVLREDVTAALLGDPLSAGPQAALAALAVACAVLAAIGFAASAAAAARERGREHAILLALGADRGGLGRTAAAESGLLVGLGTAVGVGLGAAIVHLVVPLVVLDPAARRPVPQVLVDLPTAPTLLLAVAIAALPLLSAVLGGRRKRDVATRLRHVEEM
ncbi:ABC transporter permease [Streptomyces sp. NBC_00249]|uniref:FtsX-like permease family protein n=1 Tax=Streptomyces sp. NBC_00249 TaxID=2975690 RepID=UPI0022544603|nr:FtsX-like permease family protein [Streptomyces sp. NBC_00249]MCX5195182.1 ABC transporter permease [Streptomyces sp. NBC_00249]